MEFDGFVASGDFVGVVGSPGGHASPIHMPDIHNNSKHILNVHISSIHMSSEPTTATNDAFLSLLQTTQSPFFLTIHNLSITYSKS